MLFNSWEFITYFIIVLILYFAIEFRFRPFLLLVASYLFYMLWKWEFALLMLAVTSVNYYTGLKISENNVKKQQKKYLVLSVFASLLPLLYFKYVNFFIENFAVLVHNFGFKANYQTLAVILPVGVSFFTFQAMSYSFDVYNKKTTAETNFINFAVFVAFFPQLVAGPIERSSSLLAQFRENHHFKFQLLISGSKLFIWGLFKKVVIADRLAIYVDRIYDNPELFSSSTLIVATLFFAVQIYCDFSGYSDMAIGSAKMLGFSLKQNFNLPYLANSIADFWKRWHISLSSWFGDYLYKPLGGNRVSYLRWIFNIFIVFLISGFWHGANWTFIVWGGLHALYYLFENWGDKLLSYLKLLNIKKNILYQLIKIITIFILVCFAWIFFRANSIDDALYIANKIVFFKSESLYLGASKVTFMLSVLLIGLLLAVQILQYFKMASLYFSESKMPKKVEFLWYVLLILGVSLFGISSNAFIYFQF